ncbi:hypothetical protein THASP1DRAFT_27404 [Thamnocephalis sphaerospora]|uniref:DUF1754-domain-containing protein n=1 Tax=Thamnocephalis sphaerospora TaxID=78915 RepID=A0A4V1IXE8_9FUNG|nr:hypothetical protein THASP1DRAFT_27404 [Thamnocephalis sphaerospora]|eukprot:RKP10809.1 hypothetical protein THASP1DRAFT_27404 [Thamnocephalis sphaerospora]
MSAYDQTIRTTLKFKGGNGGGIKKKSKKKRKEKEQLAAALKEESATGSGYSSSATSSPALPPVRKTKAELRFEEVQERREAEMIKKAATKSHKEKVAEFNEYLNNLSEHYDIPKVGPG